jgi:hypothetical protein
VFGWADRGVALGESGEQHLKGLVPFAGVGSIADVAAGLPAESFGEWFRQRLEPREDAGVEWLVAVQLVPEPYQERLVAAVVVLTATSKTVRNLVPPRMGYCRSKIVLREFAGREAFPASLITSSR